MKKLDILVLKSAVGPFLATFFIGNLVFLMQILYQKLDDIMGKGIGWEIMAELIIYASFTIVPLTLPLAVLISSIMTMGNLGERYELVAIKSAGISLTRAMRSLIIASILMGGVAFYFSNTVMPYTKLKYNNLLWDIKQKKSVLLIREGVFMNDFDNMTMRIDRKSDAGTMYGVIIYDHRKAGVTRVIKADSATISESDTSQYLTMHLMNGKMHEDKNYKKSYTRFGFKQLDLVIDMSSFEMGNTDEDLFKSSASLKTLKQISRDKDSLEQLIDRANHQTIELIKTNFRFLHSADENFPVLPEQEPKDSLLQTEINPSARYSTVVSRLKSIEQQLHTHVNANAYRQKNVISHEIAWYKKFALAFSCVILFFIGAPMGALVRKGGFGTPIVISILFYLLYYVFDIIGKRLADNQVITPLLGIWLSSIVLTPVAILLTRMAVLDRKINIKSIPNPFKRNRDESNS